MLNFKNIVELWGASNFDTSLKSSLEKLGVKELPLQQGLSLSNIALENNIKAVILSKEDNGNQLLIKAGIFYTGVIAGCNCADDPTPVDEQTEYCDVILNIDKGTGNTQIKLHSE